MKKDSVMATALVVLLVVLTSCGSLVNPNNISNSWRWKGKKFKQPVELAFHYQPQITVDLPIKDEPWFYNAKDSVGAAENYNVKQLLEKKLKKRNIQMNGNGITVLKIDRLLFKEYSESVSVTSIEGEYLGDSSKDFFVFEITGSLVRNDSVIKQFTTKYAHNNEPSESILLSGHIVMDGGGARADKMIENALNEFSYRVYQELGGE